MHALPPEVVDYIKETGQKTFYVAGTPGKCKTCAGTGYRGRIGIHEILVPNDAVREAVAANANFYRVALEAGMMPMLMDGVKKAAEGITSLEEVIRVAPRQAGS